MKTDVLRVVLITVFSIFTINCSDVSFSPVSDSGSSAKAVDTDDNKNNNQDFDEDTDLGDGCIECNEDEVEDIISTCRKRLAYEAPSEDAEDLTVTKHRGRLRISDVANLSLNDIRGSTWATQIGTVVEAVNIRGALRLSASEVVQVEDLRGPLTMTAHQVGDIRNVRGPICIAAHQVNEISDHRGPIIIIGSEESVAKVKSISNSRGPIILINAEVESVSDIRGPIVQR